MSKEYMPKINFTDYCNMNDKYLDLVYRESEFINSKGDKDFEYYHLVKAISKLEEVNLKEEVLSPDFIVEKKGVEIGVEIITLVNQDKRKHSGTIENILNKICEEVKGEFEENYFLNIYFHDNIDLNITKLTQECRKTIKLYLINREVMDNYFKYEKFLRPFIVRSQEAIDWYLKDSPLLSNDQKNAIDYYIKNRHIIDLFLDNKFIKKIKNKGKVSSMILDYELKGEMIQELTENVLNSFVDKKNKKISKYQETRKDCWLLLVTSLNAYSYDLFNDVPPDIKIKHGFEKVLLLHDFKNMLFEWNNGKWDLIE